MEDFQKLKYPAQYTQICAEEQFYLEGGDTADVFDTIYKFGRVFTYIGKIFTAVGTMLNSINTIYKSVVNLNNYIEKNF